MSLADPLTAPFFGKTTDGIVYYRFANRKLATRISSQEKVGQIRGQLLVMYGILTLMAFSGLCFAAALTFIIAVAENQAMSGPGFSFDLRLLYFAEVFQLGLMAIVFLIFDATIQRTLKA